MGWTSELIYTELNNITPCRWFGTALPFKLMPNKINDIYQNSHIGLIRKKQGLFKTLRWHEDFMKPPKTKVYTICAHFCGIMMLRHRDGQTVPRTHLALNDNDCLMVTEVIKFDISIHQRYVTWASWRLTSQARRLLVQHVVHAKHKGNIRASYHWPFVRAIRRSPVESPHKGPVMQNALSGLKCIYPQKNITATVSWERWVNGIANICNQNTQSPVICGGAIDKIYHKPHDVWSFFLGTQQYV